mgnify:CR=1 FL=1
MDTKQRLLEQGYQVIRWGDEVFIYSSKDVLMGCGYRENEAWTMVFSNLVDTVTDLMVWAAQLENIEENYFAQFRGDE